MPRLAPRHLAPALVWALGLALSAGCVSPRAPIPIDAESPEHPLIVRAEQAFLDGEWEDALRHYRAYREGFGSSAFDSECHLKEGLCHLRLGRPDEAETSFEASLDRPWTLETKARAHIGLGDVAFRRGDFARASSAYDRALDLHVESAPNDYALYRIGCAKLAQGDWDEGRSFLQETCRRYPDSPIRRRAERKLAFPERAYYVRVGRFANRREAGTTCGRLISRRMPARVVETEDADRPFEVWVGEYGTWREAREILARLVAQGNRSARVIP